MSILIDEKVVQHIVDAGIILKKEFPGENMQICFNLAKQHSNVNYNIKISGIEIPKKN